MFREMVSDVICVCACTCMCVSPPIDICVTSNPNESMELKFRLSMLKKSKILQTFAYKCKKISLEFLFTPFSSSKVIGKFILALPISLVLRLLILENIFWIFINTQRTNFFIHSC